MAKEWPLEIERELLADACVPFRHKHSLWNFIRYAAGWHYRCSQPEYPYWLSDEIHKHLIDWLQTHLESWWRDRASGIIKQKRLLICIPREHGKSNLITKPLPMYLMLKEPDSSSYIGSETMDMARDFFGSIKPMLDGSDPYSRFAWFYGNYHDPERTWHREALVTAARKSTAVSEPSIGTFAVERGITGKHPLALTFDDPITEEKLKEGAGKWLQAVQSAMDAIWPALRKDGLFILIGTRYLDADHGQATTQLTNTTRTEYGTYTSSKPATQAIYQPTKRANLSYQPSTQTKA
jgi:hypothetical protein